MIGKIQHATASSPEGAKGLVKGVLACAFQNMAFMLPTGLLYLLVKDMLAGSTSGRKGFYLLGCAACFALILLTTWFQYNGTYFTTYKESGTRRLTLAERLRKLPLSFFGKRDLADLTSTIMADCEVLEKDCSHFIPGLFGSLISTVLIALSLFAFDGRMALAALWVIPVSVAIVVGSYRVQDKVQAKTMAAKMACADGIQEYIETLRDLKASNAEQRYLSGLSDKIRAVEKQSIAAELETALFVSSAGMVLKLGIASVALTGSVLLVQGSIDVLTLFLALDTEVELVHAGRMPLAEFACSKRDRDVLVRLIVKKHGGVTVYQSHRNSRTDFPVLTCAVRVEDGKGCAVLGARPAKAARVELPAELAEKLAAGKASAEELKAAASEISDQFTYGSNMRGSAEYRHHLGRVLLRRCMEEIQKKEEQ